MVQCCECLSYVGLCSKRLPCFNLLAFGSRQWGVSIVDGTGRWEGWRWNCLTQRHTQSGKSRPDRTYMGIGVSLGGEGYVQKDSRGVVSVMLRVWSVVLFLSSKHCACLQKQLKAHSENSLNGVELFSISAYIYLHCLLSVGRASPIRALFTGALGKVTLPEWLKIMDRSCICSSVLWMIIVEQRCQCTPL